MTKDPTHDDGSHSSAKSPAKPFKPVAKANVAKVSPHQNQTKAQQASYKRTDKGVSKPMLIKR